MAQLYQWTVPCIICESPVEYHCNTCGDVLCSNCRDNHLKSNAGKNHDVVPYSQRTEPSKPSFQCGDHSGHQCGVWCQTCNRWVCGDCVISPNHRGHHFLKFDTKLGERRKEIQEEFDRYSEILSEWQTSLKEAENMKETFKKNVMQVDKEIVDRADELCKQVREVERENRKQLQEMKDSSLKVLEDQQKMLANGIQRLKKKVKEIEDSLRSRDSSTILQYSVLEENIPGTKHFIEVFSLASVFTPGSLNIQCLTDMFGSLSDRREESIKPMPLERKEVTFLFSNLSVESVINIEEGYKNPAIANVGSGQAWVQTDDEKLQLMTRKSKVRRTCKINFTMFDMAVTPQGNILLPDCSNNRIMTMSVEGKIKTLFSTQWKPHGICCLPKGEIVVAFIKDKSVVQYSSAGKVMKGFDRSLFQYPWYVAHSQANQQLYVCDKSDSEYYDASGRMLALDMNGILQYTYTGSETATFTPVCVCADLTGHVLITDYDNHRVHILDEKGNFIQFLLTGEQGLKWPVTIDVDSDRYAWIGEWHTGKVKVVKY